MKLHSLALICDTVVNVLKTGFRLMGVLLVFFLGVGGWVGRNFLRQDETVLRRFSIDCL